MLSAFHQLIASALPSVATPKDDATGDKNKGYQDHTPDDSTESAHSAKLGSGDMNSSLRKKLDIAKDWTTKAYNKVVISSEAVAEKVNNVQQLFDKLPIFRDFLDAQTEFVAEQQSRQFYPTCNSSSDHHSILPWDPNVSGLYDECVANQMRKRILDLSQKPNTFLLPPPSEAKLDEKDLWTPETVQLAKALLLEDPNLALMRYKLVPSRISEETFWHNYFYRVSVIRQSFQLSALTGSLVEDFICLEDASCADQTEVKTSTNVVNENSSQNEDNLPKQKKSETEGIEKRDASTIQEDKSMAPSDTAIAHRSSVPSSDRTETKPTYTLTLEEQLEAELAREIDSMVIVTSANDPQVDELDRELELELLSELNQV